MFSKAVMSDYQIGVYEVSVISRQKPVPKPRMTRRDKWEQRPCVLEYRAFKDQFIVDAKNAGLKPGMVVTELSARIFIAMPKSWSKKKQRALLGKPHMVKPGPDADNVLKSIADALQSEDVAIWKKHIEKFWDDGLGQRLEVDIVAAEPADLLTGD
jgi:Holliday junction resolvase RusA-like endonuclease